MIRYRPSTPAGTKVLVASASAPSPTTVASNVFSPIVSLPYTTGAGESGEYEVEVWATMQHQNNGGQFAVRLVETTVLPAPNNSIVDESSFAMDPRQRPLKAIINLAAATSYSFTVEFRRVNPPSATIQGIFIRLYKIY